MKLWTILLLALLVVAILSDVTDAKKKRRRMSKKGRQNRRRMRRNRARNPPQQQGEVPPALAICGDICGHPPPLNMEAPLPMDINPFPFFVRVLTFSRTSVDPPLVVCGGSLISNQFVLTAAHCVVGENTRIQVELGKQTIDGSSNSVVIIEDAPAVMIHPNFMYIYMGYDIALIKIPTVNFTMNIRPICLPHPPPPPPPPPSQSPEGNITVMPSNYTAPYESWNALAIGFGVHNRSTPEASATLQGEMFSTISTPECAQATQFGEEVASKLICAGVDALPECLDKPGGPLMRMGERAFLVGLASTSPSGNCLNTRTAFTKVASFLPWINELTKTATCFMAPPPPELNQELMI